MSRESLRRHGAVNFEKSQITELANPAYEKELFRGLLKAALKEAGMQWTDDFRLRLVVTERLPEDQA